MVEELFRQDAYLQEAEATVTALEERGVRLDRSIFYPTGGGQPGDTGSLRWDRGEARIVDAVKADGADVLHVLAPDAPRPAVGTKLHTTLDWDRRLLHMRMHTALHVMSAVIKGNVTGGQGGADKSRLDFNLLGEVPAKEWVTEEINKLIALDRPVTPQWNTDEELAARPELGKTMSVRPPMGAGRVRLLAIEGIDLQACGGTHVVRTGEIGRVECIKIENKGKMNRRLVIALTKGTQRWTTQDPTRWSAPTGWPPASMRRTSALSTARSTCRRRSAIPRRRSCSSTFPARCSSTSTRSPTRRARCPTCCRRRRSFPRACASSGWATATRSWSTTPRRCWAPRACGGCSAPWVTRTSRCSTAACPSG